MSILTIGKVAKQAGVNVETIRFYERRGLIEQPPKPDRSFRQYTPEIIKRVRFIQEAQALGFSLREIADLLELRADPSASCADVHSRAMAKKQDVRRKIMLLKRMETALSNLIEGCPKKGKLENCPIIGALASDSESGAIKR